MSEADYSQGAKDERERIVAWLRERAKCHHSRGTWTPKKSHQGHLASLIERGDHWFPVPRADQPKAPVRVVKVAIRFDGCVHAAYRPSRHHHLIRRLARRGFPTPISGEQGFVLSDGRFVGREEAWTVAEAAGQLLERAPTDGRGGTLYSEDVW